MRGRQRKYKTLEASVDERNRKLEAQLFSSCRESRIKDYRGFVEIYKQRTINPVVEDRTGSKYTLTNVLSSLIFWDARIKPEYQRLTHAKLEHIVLNAVSELPASTRNSRCGVLKTFLKRIDKPALGKSIGLVKTKTKIKIEQLVTPNDVMSMINGCLNPRDRALISLIYESGARRGELLKLSICDATPEPDGYRIRLNGKTGERRILVIDSAQFLHQWLVVHPSRKDQNAPIFCTLEDGTRVIAVSTLENILKAAASRAGIKGKRLNPHSFRHAQATEKSRYFTDAQLRTYLGWAKNSNMPSVYDHLKGESLDDDIRKMHGMLPRNPDPVTKNIECTRCHRILQFDADYCGYCTLPISDTARAKAEAANLRDIEERSRLQAIAIRYAKENPPIEPDENKMQEMVEKVLSGMIKTKKIEIVKVDDSIVNSTLIYRNEKRISED